MITVLPRYKFGDSKPIALVSMDINKKTSLLENTGNNPKKAISRITGTSL